MDKNACVIGAGGGIGAATERRLRRAGFAKLLCMDLDGPIRIDLADVSSIETAFAAARQWAPRLDAPGDCLRRPPVNGGLRMD